MKICLFVNYTGSTNYTVFAQVSNERLIIHNIDKSYQAHEQLLGVWSLANWTCTYFTTKYISKWLQITELPINLIIDKANSKILSDYP